MIIFYDNLDIYMCVCVCVAYPDMNTWNRHIHTGTQNVHNVHIYNIGIPKHEKHLRLLSSGTKLFITFELKGFLIQGERYNLSLLTFPSAPNHVWQPPQDLGEQAKVTLFFRRQDSTNWLFLNLPKSSVHASGAWRHSNPWSHPLYGIFMVTSLNDTSAPRARVNTCAHVCT